MSEQILFNPGGETLWRENALVSGRARRHEVRHYAGPLSIKSVCRGHAHWTTSKGRRKIDAASYLILPEGTEYDLEVDSPEVCETFCLFFRPGYLDEVADSRQLDVPTMLNRKGAPPFQTRETLDIKDGTIAQRLSELRRVFREGDLGTGAGTDAFRAVANCLVPRRIKEDSRTAVREELEARLEAARTFILESFAQDIDLTQIASVACLSPQHFHELFSLQTGETPFQFLCRRRLTRAKALLSQSDEPIETIAQSVGYESVSSFSRAFLRHFGVRPGQIRRSDIE